MSSMMSGRLVQPCPDCGARLRMSAMVLLSTTSAIGLIVTAVTYLYNPLMPLLGIALVLLGLVLFSMMSTRLERRRRRRAASRWKPFRRRETNILADPITRYPARVNRAALTAICTLVLLAPSLAAEVGQGAAAPHPRARPSRRNPPH
jgi:hypothetical protein